MLVYHITNFDPLTAAVSTLPCLGARDRVTVFEVIIHDPKNHHFGLRDTTRGPTQAALQSTTIAVSSKWFNHSLENGYPLVN